MKTTPEQRAALRRLCTSNEGEALPGDTEAAAGASEDVTLDLLDDLDEALAEVAALRYGLDGAMECIRRVRQAMAEKVDTDVVLAVRRVVAELAALRVVAEAARDLFETDFETDAHTEYCNVPILAEQRGKALGRPDSDNWDEAECDCHAGRARKALRAALRAWEERER